MPKAPAAGAFSGFSWDDLRLVLAIARAGNLVAAADALSVNHSTVFRRLNAVEKDIGAKLFERLVAGYQPTEAGHRLIATAELMEEQALALDRELTGRDTRLAGKLRVTASETMGFRILTDEIAAFRKQHPGILVELAVDNRVYDLSRREADVALRASRPAQGDLFGRKLVDIRWAVFASAGYLRSNDAPVTLKTLGKHQVIGWGEAAPTLAAQWIAAHVPQDAIGYRSSGLINQFMAARAGIGLALLPTYLAAADPALKRVMGLKDFTTDLWLVTHNALKDTARVRAFMSIVGEGLKRKLSAYES
jgi:DNA-binding transcriptional LysR family regulator